MLNENGAVFFEKIREALSLIDEAEKSVSDMNGTKKIRLSIYVNRRIAMQAVEKFNKEYPDVDIITKYMTSPDSEPIDIIISDTALWEKNIPREPFLCEEIILAVHRDNHLAKADIITPEALLNEPFICTNKGSSLFDITHTICESMGFTPRIVIKSDDPYYIRKCIELGLGISYIPSVSWRGEFSDQVVFKKIGGYKRTSYVYKNTDRYTPPHIQDFLELLYRECDAEISITGKE